MSGTEGTTTDEAKPAEGADASAADGSIFDLAGDGDAKPALGADGKPARPDWLPEPFWDAAGNKPNVEGLAKSWNDMRTKIARGEHKPPETADGYTLPKIEGIPETVGGKDDPLWGSIRAAAHEVGVTQQQLEKIAAPYLTHLAATMKEQGLKPAGTPEEEKAAIQAELKVELGKLGRDGAAVVRDVRDWMKGMEARGLLTPEEHTALKQVGSASGVRALAKLRELAGERPIPVNALDDGSLTEADARRMLTEGFAKSDESLIQKGRNGLAQLERAGRLKGRA